MLFIIARVQCFEIFSIKNKNWLHLAGRQRSLKVVGINIFRNHSYFPNITETKTKVNQQFVNFVKQIKPAKMQYMCHHTTQNQYTIILNYLRNKLDRF